MRNGQQILNLSTGDARESNGDEQVEYKFSAKQQKNGRKPKNVTLTTTEANEVHVSPFHSSWKVQGPASAETVPTCLQAQGRREANTTRGTYPPQRISSAPVSPLPLLHDWVYFSECICPPSPIVEGPSGLLKVEMQIAPRTYYSTHYHVITNK